MPSTKAVDCYSCATHILHRFARGYTRASAQQTITVTPRDSKHKVYEIYDNECKALPTAQEPNCYSAHETPSVQPYTTAHVSCSSSKVMP
jgi:hypothetical protein